MSQPTLALKYVAAGTEIYRLGDRTFAVGAGHMLVVPPGWSGEATIARSEATTTEGLCIYVPRHNQAVHPGGLEWPIILPASCSTFGRLVVRYQRALSIGSCERAETAASLARSACIHSERLLEETSRHLDRIGTLKAVTRYDLLSRLNKARAYLHEVTDRPVVLSEVASVASLSAFHLLRHFRDCFGAPPATYHRLIRLEMAEQSIGKGELTCAQAAKRFGFASPSSFSNAFIRIYGYRPGSRKQR